MRIPFSLVVLTYKSLPIHTRFHWEHNAVLQKHLKIIVYVSKFMNAKEFCSCLCMCLREKTLNQKCVGRFLLQIIYGYISVPTYLKLNI